VTAAPAAAAPQTLLVVGARGLGREVALHFARARWNVVCAARTAASVASLAAEIEAAGGSALGQAADLQAPETLNALSDAAAARFGRIDLCVCAQTSGLPFGERKVLDLSPADLAHALAAYPVGTLNLIRAVAPRMAAQGAGTFIQIGTGSGLKVRDGFGLLGAAQAASRALISVAASELKAAGVHAVYLAIEGQIESERAQGYVARNGLAKTLPPAAIAEAIAFLHAQDARAWTHELSLRPAAAH
jgi:NADP-dependent 3-hydroxy acid dehydrogenase YdfG